MEISQYVIDTIKVLDLMDDDRSANTELLMRESVEKAPEKQDARALTVIGGALSLRYRTEEKQFVPRYVIDGDCRSFALEDIDESDIDTLYGVIEITESNYVQTKLSHVIWERVKNPDYGRLAVKGYICEFQRAFDPENWTKCYRYICAAHQISSVMGKKKPSYQETQEIIKQKLIEMDGKDPLFLSLKMMTLIIDCAPERDLTLYELIIKRIMDKNFASSNQNERLADETFELAKRLYKRLKKDDDIKEAKTRYVSYFEKRAALLAKSGNQIRAVVMLKKACKLCVGLGDRKLLELRALLEDYQRSSLESMDSHTFSFDAKPIYDRIKALFEELSLQEAIVQFGCIAKIYDMEDVKKELIEQQKTSPFRSLFGTMALNEYGQAVQVFAPIGNIAGVSDSSELKKHMIRYVANNRAGAYFVAIEIAYRLVKERGPFSEEAFDFIVNNNGIIPENRREIIKEGLCLGLNGKLYTAMHLLVPQTESIFRNLVKLCGDTVTFLRDDGTEEYKPLSSLLGSEKLHDCYDENIIFTFQSILDNPAGENLRNMICHGLLEPDGRHEVYAKHFLGLLIRLLCMYNLGTLQICGELIKRDRLLQQE